MLKFAKDLKTMLLTFSAVCRAAAAEPNLAEAIVVDWALGIFRVLQAGWT